MPDKEVSLTKQFGAGGALIAVFLVYGVLQERIMTIGYGVNEEMFTWSAFLVLNNRFVAIIVSAAILYFKGESMAPAAPIYKYYGIAFSNTAATICQYEALKFVSFPTQTLGKCAKMIPVLILSSLLSLKKYNPKDYIIAFFVTVGCTAFVLSGDVGSKNADRDDSMFGLILMAGYLFLDGFTSTFQQKLFKDYKTTTYNQMMWNNICSGSLSLLALLMSGTFFPAVEFSLKYPAFYASAVGLSLAACSGQVILYYIIKNIGALFFSMCMVTRQVISIMLSSLLFFHPLSLGQWGAAGVVFVTIYYSKVSKSRPKPKPVLPTKA